MDDNAGPMSPNDDLKLFSDERMEQDHPSLGVSLLGDEDKLQSNLTTVRESI